MTIYLARVIMKAPDDLVVDHKSRNKSDNRKSNLRLATKSQNAHNSAKRIGKCSSKYKGVSWHSYAHLWRAYVYAGRQVHLGLFRSEIEAALAYNAEAKIRYGKFALLNEIHP